MNRIEKSFQKLKLREEKALITYVMAGDPDLRTTQKIIAALEDGGADLIELGVPFTDPLADGPVIQKAAGRGLKSGTDLAGIFRMVKSVRKHNQIPIILMSYFNPVLQYGLRRFCLHACQAGVDGVIIPDLPAGESDTWTSLANESGLDTIYLLAPTSSDQRIKKVSEDSSGFIYYVALTGITGAKLTFSNEIGSKIGYIRKRSQLPIAVGFGISSPGDAYKISRNADGIIVGSAIVGKIEKSARSALVPSLTKFVSSLKKAILKP
ncbi:MAG: tryptophan synthase subunit alpha [Nitrospirae bacterium]|nr:tryptophan synthase subunit alpha [Nitrospirota bacterium]